MPTGWSKARSLGGSWGALDQRLSVVTLGVDDLPRAVRFYEMLGWRPVEVSDSIAFFQLPGMVFSLYPREALAADIGLDAKAGRGSSAGSITLAYNARTREEVETVVSQAVEAGGRLVKQPAEAFWGGYSGYFSDPNGHLWEVAYNPHWTLDEIGRVTVSG